MTKHLRLALIASAWLALPGVAAAQPYPPLLVAAHAEHVTPTAASGLPANLVVPASHRHVLQEMWEKSPTFRVQCERIARARGLIIRIHLFPSKARLANGSTHLVIKPGAALTADVYIGQHKRVVELIAHEIEHIIERLEGIDLSQVARRAPDVVWASAEGEYETRRALRSGLVVASEVMNARD
jgi:hypothetical protein